MFNIYVPCQTSRKCQCEKYFCMAFETLFVLTKTNRKCNAEISPAKTHNTLQTALAKKIQGECNIIAFNSYFAYGPKDKESSEAVRRYSRILKEFPDNVHVLEQRAHLRTCNSEWKRAAKDYEHVLKARPNDVFIWGRLGIISIYGRMPEQTVIAFSRAMELDPDEQWYPHHSFRGWAYRKLKQWDASIADYTKAIELGSPHADEYLGELYMEMKEYEKAADAFTLAIKKYSFSFYLYRERGKAYIKTKQFEKVIENATFAIGKYHFYVARLLMDMLSQRAFAYKRLGQKEKAEADIALIKQVTLEEQKEQEQNKTLYEREAEQEKRKAEQEKRKKEKAIQKYTAAIEAGKINKETLYNRGIALMENGEHKEAIKDFDNVLRIAEGFPELYTNRAFCYDATGQIKKSLNDYAKALSLDPGLAIVHEKRAAIYELLGETEKEIASLEKLKETNSASVNHIKRLAVLS